jgi:NADPH:quinone reductase-like Zn-dependent oxidoreductase
MRTTRVIRFHQPGGPEVLQIDDIPLAKPQAGEVLVRVQAMALNRADALWRAATYVEDPIVPARIGYDIAGVVEEVGPDVAGISVGDKVSAIPAASVTHYGNHGETAIYPADSLIKYPARLSPEEAVAVNNGLLTAYFAMVEVAQIKRGQAVVLTAGSSSTAMAALQIANRLGARAIATTRSRAKFQTLVEAGFDHVVVTDEKKVTEEILRATGGAGADLIYDAVAGPGLGDLASATKVMGHLVVYGALGAMTAETPLPLWPLFRRTVKMYAGYKVFDFTGNKNMGLPRNQPAVDRALKFLIDGLESGAFKPRIDKVFKGLDEYADAHRYLESNAQSGKIVISLR